MNQIFICRGCGIPGVQCTFSTTGEVVESDDICCPKRVLNYLPVWRELVEME